MTTVADILKQKRAERRIARFQKLAKAFGAAPPKGKTPIVKLGGAVDPAMPKPPADMLPKYTKAGGYVRVQRPNLHAAPVLAQLLGEGKHGVTCVDATGTKIKVRHEHVLERNSMPTPDERSQYLSTQARHGAPVDASERFIQQDHVGKMLRRPSEAQIGLLTEVARHGTPIDIARLQSEGTHEDAESILRRFVNDPKGLVSGNNKRRI